MPANTYAAKAKVWVYPGAAGWHFVTLLGPLAKRIKARHGAKARGWGSLPVRATIGKTSWLTSIFPDAKEGTYLLPLKAEVRKKEHVGQGDVVALKIEVRA